jgi:hypothetical protein
MVQNTKCTLSWAKRIYISKESLGFRHISNCWCEMFTFSATGASSWEGIFVLSERTLPFWARVPLDTWRSRFDYHSAKLDNSLKKKLIFSAAYPVRYFLALHNLGVGTIRWIRISNIPWQNPVFPLLILFKKKVDFLHKRSRFSPRWTVLFRGYSHVS